LIANARKEYALLAALAMKESVADERATDNLFALGSSALFSSEINVA
jgi:hypothetical protein